MTRIQLFNIAVPVGIALVETKDPIELSLALGNAAQANKVDGADFSTFTQYAMQTVSTYKAMAVQKLPSEIKAAQESSKKVAPATENEPQQPTVN